jgi:hypothetical protein
MQRFIRTFAEGSRECRKMDGLTRRSRFTDWRLSRALLLGLGTAGSVDFLFQAAPSRTTPRGLLARAAMTLDDRVNSESGSAGAEGGRFSRA